MTKSIHRHCTFKTVLKRKRRRSGFSAEMQRREERAQKWRAVADCSRHEQRRPGRLDCRRWELSSADNQWWRRGRAQLLSSVKISWSAEFVCIIKVVSPHSRNFTILVPPLWLHHWLSERNGMIQPVNILLWAILKCYSSQDTWCNSGDVDRLNKIHKIRKLEKIMTENRRHTKSCKYKPP